MSDALLQAQKRLGHTLERASIGEDRELAAAVREKGEAFTNLFYGALRMARMYDIDNDTFERPTAELRNQLGWLIEHLGSVHLVTVEEQVYVNDVRIRFRGDMAAAKLGAELYRHNVGSLTFHVVPDKEQLLGMVAALSAPNAESGRRAALLSKFTECGVSGIEVGGVNRYLLAGEEKRDTEWTEVLERAADLVEEVFNNVGAGRILNPLSLRRVIVELLSAGIDTEGLWEDITHKTEHAAHAVRVCRLSLCIGDGVGFDDKTQQDLGIAALVHDVGYAMNEGTGRSLTAHLKSGALAMLRQAGFHDAKLRRILAILFHHHDYEDLKKTPSLFARVLRIAEDFDNLSNMTRGKMTPPEALALMAGGAKKQYDPALLQAAINRLGRYPPGTRLELDGGRRGRSISLSRDNNWDKPRVRLDSGQVVDLSQSGRVLKVLKS